MTPALRILGTRGIPAAHGGFETFAERLALHLVGRGWRVTVYCQVDGHGPVTKDTWCGVERINIPVVGQGPGSSVAFDWRATGDAARAGEPCLTLGYNTAVFCLLLRAAGLHNTINMDGIEWRRDKWSTVAKAWFWLNEHVGARVGNHLVADHPEIARHLQRSVSAAKISIIPYGAERLEDLPEDSVRARGLRPGHYLTLVARPEPENSVLEIVRAFSRRQRGLQLAVLGDYRDENPYHQAVRAAAGPEVIFLGAIYETAVVQALRLHGLAYVHGHRVGGTNPSLVEALGAGNPVIAHDNPFNRWVAGDAARYFSNLDDLSALFDTLPEDAETLKFMKEAALRRHASMFTWDSVLQAYENILLPTSR